MNRLFHVARNLATALLLVAVIEGVAVAGLKPGYGLLGISAALLSVFVICFLYELD